MKKLRNKKTGEIIAIYKGEITIHYDQGRKTIHFKNLEDLDDWEDYEEPKEWYWFIEDDGVIQRSCHYEDLHPTLDKARKKIGNYFSSREEAVKAVEKLEAWKLLKDEFKIKFDGIIRDDKAMLKGVKLSYDRHQVTLDRMRECVDALHLLFGGEK